MKSYICIGGPLHGQRKALPDGCKTVVVPQYEGECYIGTARVEYAPVKLSTGTRESRYNVKTVANREEKQATGDDGITRATVTVEVRRDVLVHESILTFDEAVAYLHKMTSRSAGTQAVSRAMSLITL